MKETPKKVTLICCLLILALAIFIKFPDLFKSPIIPQGTRGGWVALTPSPPNGSTIEITLYTDRNKINRINSRRRPEILRNQELSGPYKAFKPLLTIKTQGPANFTLKGGKITRTVRFYIPKGTYTAHVFPYYNTEALFNDSPTQETLTLFLQKDRDHQREVWSQEVEWSGPEELFLSTKNLIDIAGMLPAKQEYTGDDPRLWVREWGKTIENMNLLYESENSFSKGWQPIRSEAKMKKDGRANCLDIAVLTAKAARQKGFDAHIFANSGHALTAIKRPSDPITALIPFEGTDFLIKKENPEDRDKLEAWKASRPIEEEKKRPTPIPEGKKLPEDKEKEPPEDQIFWIDLQTWETAYRKNT